MDDEETVLDLYKLQLGIEFEISTAVSAETALEQLRGGAEYAVIVADKHLPGMAGDVLLQFVQAEWPATVRIMLTADSHQVVAADAVNRGHVFRFLNKPCLAAEFRTAVRDAVREHQSRCAEHDILASTVNGSVRLLSEVLAIVRPDACSRARRICRTAEQICRRYCDSDAWEVSIAAMLCELGCLTLPPALVHRALRRAPLATDEAELWDSHPRIAHDLISHIPRLQRIAKIVLLQNEPYQPSSELSGDNQRDVRWRASCLRIVLRWDNLVEAGHTSGDAAAQILDEAEEYPPDVVAAFRTVVEQDSRRSIRELRAGELSKGMVLAEDLKDVRGRLLLTKGQEIGAGVLIQISPAWKGLYELQEPIRVLETEAQQISEGADGQPIPTIPRERCGMLIGSS
ncbi:MAG: response regulator [Planctomycetaceae bacterium]